MRRALLWRHYSTFVKKVKIPFIFSSRFESKKWSHNKKLAKSLIDNGIEEGFSKFVVDNSNITGTFLLDMNIHYPLRVFIYGDEQFNEEYISRCIQRAFRKRLRLSKDKKIETGTNNGFCLIFEGSDGLPGIKIEIFASFAYIKIYSNFWMKYIQLISNELMKNQLVSGVYLMNKDRNNYSLTHVEGKSASDEPIIIEERGIKYFVNLFDTVSFGLYLDHRENRTKLLDLIKSKPENIKVLSTFSHTCGFSLTFSKYSQNTTTINVDSSNRYLEIGRQNFVLNGIDIKNHQFINEDVFKFIEDSKSRNSTYDLVILDPPPVSFNTSIGTFSTKYHYDQLINIAKPLVKEGGFLICFDTFKLTTRAEWMSKIKSTLNEDWKQILELRQSYDYPERKSDHVSSYLKGVVLKYK